MEDETRNDRRGRPQQKLYRPGSGPLRKSSPGSDIMESDRLDSFIPPPGSRGRGHNRFRNKVERENFRDDLNRGPLRIVNEDGSDFNQRSRKSERPLYAARSGGSNSESSHFTPARDSSHSSNAYSSNDHNFNRNYRQVSEPRSSSPQFYGDNNSHRNRDTRSMETSAARHNNFGGHGGKPPSGRRFSSGCPSEGGKYNRGIPNLESLPPRFQRKYLAESGQLSLDSNIDYSNRDHYSSPLRSAGPANVWSQTLPSRGRGRIKDIEYERDRFMSSYMKSYDTDGSRHSTPMGSRSNLFEPNSDQVPESVHGKHNFGSSHSDLTQQNSTQHKNSRGQSNDKSLQKQSSIKNYTVASLTNAFSNLTNLDINEVEKNKKNESDPASNNQENKKSEQGEPQRVKSRRSRRHSKNKKNAAANRSSSRGNLNENPERPLPMPLKLESHLRDSGSESIGSGRYRERRDSHRSNRSSAMGSREDLDRWRSVRSYSREQSPERRIVSQCNSRDPSGNRAASPRDLDGFRVPQPMHGKGRNRNQRRNSSSSSAWRSSDREGRSSPAPAPAPRPGPAPEQAPPARAKKSRSGRRRENRSPRGKRSPKRNGSQQRNKSPAQPVNWREEIIEMKKKESRSQESGKKREASHPPSDKPKESSNVNSHPGILLLPQPTPSHIAHDASLRSSQVQTKTLYDPQNPDRPIVVQTNSHSGADLRNEKMSWAAMCAPPGESARPSYYDESSEGHRAAKNRALLVDMEVADTQLQQHCAGGAVAVLNNWEQIMETRRFLQNVLQRLLISDLKFCSVENIEHHFWRILYYKFIEVLRKHLTSESTQKEEILALINNIIDEGNKYFENLVELLEKAYKFKVEDYLNGPHLTLPKGLGFVGLGLHSVQKIYLFLGDLARYKEQVNDSANYGKSKFWYTKAQQINPKNGRPYNQLAILAVYSRRKLDAVYYYMRSLMSSNPFHSARESLISLFDENRKKYESAERKRRAAREAARLAAGEGEASRGPGGGAAGGASARGLRREVWVRPGGGRTTTLRTDDHMEDDELANMTCVELNKNFITSYLHVHGKLITKIGMESLHESASLMLRQFRALLRQQPLPTTANRLLQLAALNMFAIETCLSNSKESGAHAHGECALGVALLMFGLMVERCRHLLLEPPGTQSHADALLILPAVKVWCDWMMCHSSVWNPPPSLDAFKLGADSDPWEWLAKLMNVLEEQDDKSIVFETEPKNGAEAVRLSEDAGMAGFTPLMYMEVEPAYAAPDPAGGGTPEHALRTRKLLFFGTEFLVGVDPPAIRLHYPPGEPPRYVSAVRPPPPEDEPLQDVSEDEEPDESKEKEGSGASVLSVVSGAGAGDGGESDEATRRLLRRKEMLEARRLNMDRRRQRMQEILRGGWVSVELEVRPRWLVPDTNCFIDHLPLLQRVGLAPCQPYTLAVPLVVVRELEGLSRCARVGGAARAGLAWLGAPPPSVRFATTRGSLLASAAFTAETEAGERHASNDDRVLAAALSLHANLTNAAEGGETAASGDAADADAQSGQDGARTRRLVREVVLLTDDRSLRVKALAAELPARDLPAFVQWAAIQPSPAPLHPPAHDTK